LLAAALHAVDALQIAHMAVAPDACVGISIGAVVWRPQRGDRSEAALQQADALLYDAKAQGRGQALLRTADGTLERVGR